mmetsp:Transcript_1300/g.2913  ORF Transcript_1300/g.2913 Transcript_1300/m.2913 type:complete len:94 (-) Transcript_1300:1222-1503(-)
MSKSNTFSSWAEGSTRKKKTRSRTLGSAPVCKSEFYLYFHSGRAGSAKASSPLASKLYSIIRLLWSFISLRRARFEVSRQQLLLCSGSEADGY